MNKKLSAMFIVIYYLIISILALAPIRFLDGWPRDHDGMLLFYRVGVFREEILSGNFHPLWTSLGQNGYGSAFPFLYHCFYNTLTAVLSLATHSVFTAVVISIPLLLFIGAMGMHKLMKQLGLPLIYSLCAATLLVFSNYIYTDWLIRGDVAEFTAFIFVPWLYYYLCALHFRDASDSRTEAARVSILGVKIGIVLACLFYSHIVIFYYSSINCAIFYFVYLFRDKNFKKNYVYIFPWIVLAVLLFVTGPTALGIILFKPLYNFSALTAANWAKPFNNYVDTGILFFNGEYRWGQTWHGLSLEIGRVFASSACFLTSVILILSAIKKIAPLKNDKRCFVYLSIFLCFITYFYLECTWSAWFYLYVPLVSYIQFPWRLHGYLTVLLIILLCFSVNILANNFAKYKKVFGLFLVGCALYQVTFGVTMPKIHYEIMSRHYIESEMSPENLLVSGEPPEYLPNTKILPPTPRATIEIKPGCHVVRIQPNNVAEKIMNTNKIIIQLSGNQAENCQIIYNQFLNPFTEVKFSDSGKVLTSHFDTYVIIPESNKAQKITIKRVGLIHALKNYLLNREYNYLGLHV